MSIEEHPEDHRGPFTGEVAGSGLHLRSEAGLVGGISSMMRLLHKSKVHSLKIRGTEPGMVMHTFNPRTWKAEAGGSL